MKRILLCWMSAALLAVPAWSAHAQLKTQPLAIASGPLGNTYRDIYAPNLGRLLHGYKPVHWDTTGSGANLDLLASGKVDLAFAQADVYATRLADDPTRYGRLVVIGKVADECVYVARRKTSPISNLAQLGQSGAKPATVAIGPPGGGASGTWDYLSTLVAGLDQVDTRPAGGTLALNQLAAGAYDAVLWVTDPNNLEHPNFRAVELNDALTLMALTEPGLINALPDGTRVYQARILKLDDRENAPVLSTVCTSALVLARDDADPRLIKKAADALALNAHKIAPRAEK